MLNSGCRSLSPFLTAHLGWLTSSNIASTCDCFHPGTASAVRDVTNRLHALVSARERACPRVCEERERKQRRRHSALSEEEAEEEKEEDGSVRLNATCGCHIAKERRRR